jgi:hypothetical protein
MKRTLTGAVAMILLGLASGAGAQNVERPSLWDAPSFLGPRPGSDIGVYLVDGEGSSFGLHGLWRTDASPNLGLRLGYLDTAGDDIILFGVETWGDVVLESTDFPLDLTWTFGAGAWVNGSTTVSVPVGLSIGKTLDLEDSPIALQVYGHPRLALVMFEHPVTNDLELDLEGQFDLGTDILLSPDLTLRVAASLGRFDALGIGLALRQ